MKKFLLGFVEGYFIVSLIIYIATYLILKKPINTLFYPEIYPVLFGIFYLGYKVNKSKQSERLRMTYYSALKMGKVRFKNASHWS